jgi:hypothetical protein
MFFFLKTKVLSTNPFYFLLFPWISFAAVKKYEVFTQFLILGVQKYFFLCMRIEHTTSSPEVIIHKYNPYARCISE